MSEEQIRWEYLTWDLNLHVNNDPAARDLDTVGEAGWELVAVTPLDIEGENGLVRLFFKRPRSAWE